MLLFNPLLRARVAHLVNSSTAWLGLDWGVLPLVTVRVVVTERGLVMRGEIGTVPLAVRGPRAGAVGAPLTLPLAPTVVQALEPWPPAATGVGPLLARSA